MPLDRVILGIQIGHDASAAIVSEGRIIAAAGEERFSRIKNHDGVPHRAIAWCIKFAGVNPKRIEMAAFAMSQFPVKYLEGHSQRSTDLRSAFEVVRSQRLQRLIRRERIEADLGFRATSYQWFDHHFGHAASAYFTSGWDECLAITIDATDGEICATANVCRDGVIHRFAQTDHHASPGYFYIFVTELLGYKRLRHEGKITGLAAYGSGDRLYDEFRKVIALGPAKNHFVLGFDPTNVEHTEWPESPLLVPNSLIESARAAPPEEVAAAAQSAFEDVIVEHVATMLKITGQTRVALAGGAFANVRLNQRIAEIDGVSEVYIHPNMGDGGLAAGSALLAHAELAGHSGVRPYRLDSVLLGPSYPADEVRKAVTGSGQPFAEVAEPEPFVARLLAQGKVVGWFNGRMENGPRALGNRSILAAPVDPSINKWLNERLRRTEFMPFAPSVLDRAAPDIFENYSSGAFASEFMTITFSVRQPWRIRIPAVVHVDGTARPQVVRREVNPNYYRIIEEYEKITGLPVILNTSFNIHEEPIVASPADALRAFADGRLDALVMGGLVVSRDGEILAMTGGRAEALVA